ncbi:MAG: NAD(P)H-hydrate epimerase, partial [Longimicrobiales bacterium]
PTLSTEDMVAVDRAMIEDYGIELIQMMENAGSCLARVAVARFLAGDPRGRRIVVLAGSGGNGGGALVAARRLAGWGADVEVRLSTAEVRLQPVAAHQLSILRRLEILIAAADAAGLHGAVEGPDLIIDGLIGYSLAGTPRGAAADLIKTANESDAPVLSLDVPSGLAASSGAVHEPTIRASATLTLALPKHGLLSEQAREIVGELYLADIGVPAPLYLKIGLEHPGPLFAEGDIVRLQ